MAQTNARGQCAHISCRETLHVSGTDKCTWAIMRAHLMPQDIDRKPKQKTVQVGALKFLGDRGIPRAKTASVCRPAPKQQLLDLCQDLGAKAVVVIFDSLLPGTHNKGLQ